MTETFKIKIKSTSGSILDIEAQEIIDIGGKPYQAQENWDSLEAVAIQSEARITSLEQLVNSLVASLGNILNSAYQDNTGEGA